MATTPTTNVDTTLLNQPLSTDQTNYINQLNGRLAPSTTLSSGASTGAPAERKTDANPAEPTIVSSTSKNILSGYRSYTYNFTIACLSQDEIGVPESYIDKPLNRVILSSSGKQSTMTAGDTNNTPQQDQANTKKLLGDFNNSSSGRFNLFMDNLEIESIISFTELSNATQPTTFTFSVFEPYSVNGFFQALSVASITAGWNTYSLASFVLLIEFIGYPDDPGIPDPVVLKEKRYIPFKFTGTGVEITEKGTYYKCEAISWNEQGFGRDGKLLENATAHGTTLNEILTDLMDQVNTQLDKSRGPKKHHTYKIRIDDPDISKAAVIEVDKDISSYSFLDPQTVPTGQQNYQDGSKNKTTK